MSLSTPLPSAFFAYPSQPPALRETVLLAAEQIGHAGVVRLLTWEELKVSGTFIISSITAAIDRSSLVCYELTRLNLNVLFELGYAIGANKSVWILRDSSDAAADRDWNQLRTLTTVGYVAYQNADQIVSSFFRDRPFEPSETIFSHSIEPALQPAGPASVFYVTSLHDTDAKRQLTRRLQDEQKRGVSLLIDDATEASAHPLAWYARNIYSSSAVLVHFADDFRHGAAIHNARCSLVSGLAHGMKRPLLMLATSENFAPIDYRDLLRSYKTARECSEAGRAWLAEHIDATVSATAAVPTTAYHLPTELRNLRLGEYVAEHEADALADYFIETAAYREVLQAGTTVFVGRKGAGKTANFLRAGAELAKDKRNLVCVIKPAGYELEGVVSLLTSFGKPDVRDYLVIALWKYLLYTEIAISAASAIRGRPAPPLPDSPDARLLNFVDNPDNGLLAEFAVRLERAVSSLKALVPGGGIEQDRGKITQALYDTALQALRRLLGEVLTVRERVALLVDNLDKAWDRRADIDELSHFLVGLLTAITQVSKDFARKDAWRKPVRLTAAIFLRNDIFAKLARVAREPDKIPVARLLWERNLLRSLVEERYAAARDFKVTEGELWQKFFEPVVAGVPAQDYILSRILPRPRDVVFFCSAAIFAAIDGRHPRVTEQDVLQAEKSYSQFAFEAIQVENGVTLRELEAVLFEFTGEAAVLTEERTREVVCKAGIAADRAQSVLDHLLGLSFLGVEVDKGVFEYFEDPRDSQKLNVLAEKLAEKLSAPRRVMIHPAFRAYLEIREN